MSKNNSILNKFSILAGKIGRQRHLAAVRDGFITLMPLMIVGSLVTLINKFPISSGGEGKKQFLSEVLAENRFLSWITNLNANVWWGTFGMLSIFAVASIAYYLAKHYESDGLSAAVISLACFFSAVPQIAVVALGDGSEASGWGFINYKYINASGLFVGIIIALIATEIFVRLSRTDKLIIKMPEGVPPAVSKSFAALLPGILTVLIVTIVTVLIEKLVEINIFDFITKTIMDPLTKSSGSLGFGIIIVLLTHVLWGFGIHGPNIFEGILQPLNAVAIEKNIALLDAGAKSGFLIFNKSFVDAFVYMGGAGVGLGLIIAILLASKSKQNRMVGRLGAAPGLFNINEPILFGLPIVLNPVFIIPFVIAPLISLLIAYGATVIGFLPVVRAVIPWTTPPIFSGLFATGFAWQGVVIQVINLTLSVLIYLPFVKIADKLEKRKEEESKEII